MEHCVTPGSWSSLERGRRGWGKFCQLWTHCTSQKWLKLQTWNYVCLVLYFWLSATIILARFIRKVIVCIAERLGVGAAVSPFDNTYNVGLLDSDTGLHRRVCRLCLSTGAHHSLDMLYFQFFSDDIYCIIFVICHCFLLPDMEQKRFGRFRCNLAWTLCLENRCDYVFDDNLNSRRPIVIIFGTVITKTISHLKIVLLSHLTYFVQLPYLGKLLNLKIRRFSLKHLFVILINKVQQ